jgi:psp operon transcriptional activator
MDTYEAVGQSEAFLDFQEQVTRAAGVHRPVLLLGERGTGKELAAARLHYLSPRWQGPLVALNCAALAPSLIETELFGHEKGAFTGADRRRQGRFEAADGGTLFLDEIGAIPLEVQAKVLRAVEYGTFERVGSAAPVEVDVRIVGATHADLPALAREGRFLQDLLDRLAFEVLFVPPLRSRRGDILLLAEHFARRMAVELGWEGAPDFAPQALAALESHPWPGNVRELKNVVERAVHRSGGGPVREIVLDPFQSPYAPAAPDRPRPPGTAAPAPGPTPQAPLPRGDETSLVPLKEAVADLEVVLLRRALDAARHNQRQAARRLGLTYHQLRGLLRKHAGVLGRSGESADPGI